MRRGTAQPRLVVLAALTLLAAICPALQVARPAPASASAASPRVTARLGHTARPPGAALASSHAALIAAGNAHACVIQSGQAYCWGSNSGGQLGDGSTSSTTSPVPVYTGGVLAGRTLTQIVAGGSSTCALDSAGLAYCWGLDSSGQLGNNSTTQSLVPVAVSTSGALAGKTLVELAAGQAHVCALDSTGTVYCWGSNGNGQLGNNSTTKSLVPVAVTTSGVLSGVTVAQVTAGFAHTCAVSSAGTAYCWGANGNGQLGNSTTTQSLVPVAVTTSGVLSGVTLTQISGDQNGQYTCALSAAGAAYCWGAASFGQLGNGGSSTPGVPVAVSTSGVLSGVTLAQIATGSGTTCALSTGGAGYCWGQNANGELGNNSTTSTTVPVTVTTSGLGSGETLAQVSLGTNFACALDSANAVFCWGLNTSGQVGNPATGVHFLVPTAVTSQSTISAGYVHSCMIRNGRAYCWGDNTYGELGNGTATSSSTPVAVSTSGVLSGVILTQVTAGYYFTCALSSAGSVYCWGRNAEGELGDNSTASSPVPVAVSTSGVLSGTTVTQISSDAGLSECALGRNGAAYCWGMNSSGQLGNSTVTSSSIPVAVSTSGVLSGVTLTQVSAGTNSTCALSSTGATYCWGGNANGQLGNNSTAGSSVPVVVTTSGVLSGVTVTQVSAGNGFACAVGGTGAAYCWGANGNGQLGNSSTTQSLVPVAVTTSGVLSGVTVTQISAAASYTCALGGTGAPYCWGLNGGGQLGNGSTTTSSVPVAVTTSGVLSGVTVTQVSAGNTVACAAGSTGAYCWGTNGSGQAGDGTTTQRNVPVQVLLLSPGAPTGVTATAGDTTAVVSWTAPASLGTGTLTGYAATAQPGGASCSATTTSCTITGLTDGTAYTVSVVTRTTDGNSAPSPAVSVTPETCLSSPYAVTVAADSPTLWYPLNDTTGTTAHDYSATPHNGVYQGGVTLGAAGPTSCGTAATFNGSTGYVSNANTITSPATFSIEAWFKTTTTSGGMIAGFGNAVTGPSANYDRHIYMNNAGQVYFGVAFNQTVHSATGYNNGSWHQAVGTEGPAGLQLYIDGALAASASTPTSPAQTYTGSWRVGYDSLGGWTSNPSSNYFAGSLAEASFYGTQLSSARVAAHYVAATGAVLTITSTASATSTTPGSVVSYTITAVNTGAAPYTAASISDSLSGVLDDAVYNGDATATAGSLSYTSPSLSWTGSLAVGARVTITFSVTVNNPDTGDKVLVTTITSPTSGSNCPAGSSSGQCTVTVAIIAGPLTITAPASGDLGSGPPGATIGSGLGTVQVTDDRGFGAGWTATVSSSDFTTGGGSPAQTIPAGDATYAITGLATVTGSAVFTYASTVKLSGSPQAVVSATNVNGNTAVTWDPVINVTVPAEAIGGAYTATITHSVS